MEKAAQGDNVSSFKEAANTSIQQPNALIAQAPDSEEEEKKNEFKIKSPDLER
jgi:hypothetical protein